MRSGVLLVAVVLGVLATALLLRRPGACVPGEDRSGRFPSATRHRARVGGVLVGTALTAAVLLLDGVRLALATVCLVAVAGSLHLRARDRRRRAAVRTRTAVVEVGEALVGELRAGRDVETALARAADAWEPFASVARAAVLGADVPGALRRVAGEPGAEGLGDLAVAWEVAARTGAGLADVLTQVVDGSRDVHEDLRTVATELASARSTARLMVLLPVVTLGLAAGTGSAPWRLLVSSPLGVACLGGGVTLALAGLLWIDRIADGVIRR